MKADIRRIVSLVIAFALTPTSLAQELIELPDFGDSAGAVISQEQERKIAKDFMRQMRRMAPVVTDEEVEHYIQELGESMSELTDYFGDFNFMVIDSPQINAFAVPGGFLAFYSGLILATETEAELASVMAHELTHITQRHGARMFEEASQMNLPMIAALIGSLALAVANPEAGSAALMATQAAAVQHQINFTRGNEKEADAIGLRLMSEAGYDTQKMAVFFERLQRANRYSDPKHVPEYLRTHPITINRIAEARSRAETVAPAIVREDRHEYHLVKAKLRVRSTSDPMRAVNYFLDQLRNGGGYHENVARYGYALALTESGDLDRARIELVKLMADYPSVMSFRMAAGQLEKTARDFVRSLDHFEIAFRSDPENRAAVYSYINALLLVGRAGEAKTLLRNYGLSDRRDPKFYKLLAETENSLGEIANSHHSLAEYYMSLGEFPHAAEQLRLARGTPGLSNYQRQKIVARLEEVEETIQEQESERRQRP